MNHEIKQPLEFTVTVDQEEMRLDAFLVESCPELSRNSIQADLKEEHATVDGRIRPKSFRLKAGQKIVYLPQLKPPIEAVAQDIPLDIVYQDDDILIINKPIDLVVHPATGHPDGTLVNALLFHCRNLATGDDPLRPGIVHRLDRDTSGLMAVALTEQAHAHLGEQLRTRQMGRTYESISWGRWTPDTGSLSGDIGRHPKYRQKMAIVEEGGRPATTHYEVVENFNFVQLCRVKLETGRTHQIRVHFAANHHPVVGDHLYGDDRRAKGVHPLDRSLAATMVKHARRQMLHASELKLIHPTTEEELSFSVDMPSDMNFVLKNLREQSE